MPQRHIHKIDQKSILKSVKNHEENDAKQDKSKNISDLEKLRSQLIEFRKKIIIEKKSEIKPKMKKSVEKEGETEDNFKNKDEIKKEIMKNHGSGKY